MDIEIKISDAEQYKKIKDTIKEIIKSSEENNSSKFKKGLKNRDFKMLLEGIAESSLFTLFIKYKEEEKDGIDMTEEEIREYLRSVNGEVDKIEWVIQ